MVKKSLSLVYRTLKWLIILSAFIVLTVALVIHFYVFPHIGDYKNTIAQAASKAAKQTVEIGNIQADWVGITPHLLVSNIQVFDQQHRPALQLNNVDVRFSWLSIPKLEPHLAKLTIRAPELTIRRNAQGQIFIAGTDAAGQSNPEIPNWLLRQSQFKVENATVIWLDEMRNAPPLSLNNLNLKVTSPPWASLLKKHRIEISAQPSVGTAEPISLSADVFGNDVAEIAQWRGTLDAHLKNADLAAFKPWLDYPSLTKPIDLETGKGSADVTIQFGDHQIQSLSSQLELTAVKMQLRTHALPVELKKLSGKLNWINTVHSHKLTIENLSLTAGNGLALSGITGSFGETLSGNRTLNFKVKLLDLALIQPYLLQLPIPPAPLEAIAKLAPTGSLNQLAFNWSGNKTETQTYQLTSAFQGLGVTAYEKIPGFTNLSGNITANEHQGRLSLHTKQATIEFKNILRWPIPADQLSGDVTWLATQANKQTNYQIETRNLQLQNAHLAGTLEASYLIDGHRGGLLDLKGRFGKGNAKFAPFYYPIILGEKTTAWLDSSILSGHAENINLIVKGRLADFPFVNKQHQLDPSLGLFRVTADISNAQLAYGKDWPTIEGIALRLLFEGKRMELNSTAGQILGNQIAQSKTTIAQLDADSPILEINGVVNGKTENGIQFVNKSPVATVTQGFTDDLKTTGQGQLNLNLKIPLKDVESAQFKGSYQITNGTMQSENMPHLTDINGALEFTEHSLSAKNIVANAYGSPVNVSLNSNTDKSVRVLAKGKMSDASIKQAVNSLAAETPSFGQLANYFSGAADWQADILIQKPKVTINVQSELVGLQSRLPSPFSKNTNEALSLTVQKQQSPNLDEWYIKLGNKLASKVVRTGTNNQLKIERGSIVLNASSSALDTAFDLSKNKGLNIVGNLDYLDADAWRRVFQETKTNTNAENNSTSTVLPINKMAIKINTLDVFDRRINDLKISQSTNNDGQHANVQSREMAGDLQWVSQGNGKLIARLSHLVVPEATPNRTKSASNESNNQEIKKQDQDYPALDISAASFTFNKKNLGSLDLVAFPQGDNWNIEKLKLSTADSVMTAFGQWNNWAKNPNTFLNISWDIKNLGKTLNGVGYPDTIKGGEGKLEAQLHWPGSPHQFNPKGLTGDLEIDLKNGQFLKVQPGVGRLLGLLSLQSLPRRLTLDFRDLFSNGFAFDDIKGSAKITQGIMRSDNFTMSGPAADVLIKGETNLQAETQHLKVKVSPHVSDSLSIAALAGGPVVGAVTFIAQKILKDPLNKIASSEYEIIGTWDNPQEVNAPQPAAEPNKQSPLQQTK